MAMCIRVVASVGVVHTPAANAISRSLTCVCCTGDGAAHHVHGTTVGTAAHLWTPRPTRAAAAAVLCAPAVLDIAAAPGIERCAAPPLDRDDAVWHDAAGGAACPGRAGVCVSSSGDDDDVMFIMDDLA